MALFFLRRSGRPAVSAASTASYSGRAVSRSRARSESLRAAFLTVRSFSDRSTGFFAAFYHALYVVGADAVAALGAAALVHPECARFRCHMRIDGKLVALKAGDDDLLPEED